MEIRIEKEWQLREFVPEDVKQKLSGFSALEQQLLFNRDICDLENAERYLEGTSEVYDPFLLKDMGKASARICWAIEAGQRILIFGDYDVDGVTATALLYELIMGLGGEAVHYIPNRFEEGYGFSEESLEGVFSFKPELIITVDCGIRSIKEVEMMEREGVDVIITDHHQPLPEIPQALAIINHKQAGDTYPFKELAGVGLAYKLAQAVTARFPEKIVDVKKWLDLVALGTVADLAPLTDENRTLVRQGINLINDNPRPGIAALITVSRSVPGKINSRDIGFRLGPRLNAAGRLTVANNAFNLLISTSAEEAKPLALKLDEENKKRQIITKEIQQVVETYFEALKDDENEFLIFHADENFNEGVVGLAASRLVERFYRPAIIGTRKTKEGSIKASCRSIPELNIIKALDECSDLLEKHGGHAMAAGLTLKTENEAEFQKRLIEIIKREFAEKEIQPKVSIDAEIDPTREQPDALLKFLDKLEPTGMENPAPIFASRNISIIALKKLGKEKDHLRFFIKTKEGKVLSAIAFSYGQLADNLENGDRVDLLYSYELNEYNGEQFPQLNVKEIKTRN